MSRAAERALERLWRALEPLRLYRLRANSLIDRELAAYAAALALAEERLERCAAAAFVQTADGAALARFEELVGLAPREGLDADARRLLVLYRLGAAPFDFHREGMANSVRATGMEAQLEEDPAGERLVVRCLGVVDPTLDLDGMKRSVRAALPAHLEVEFEMGELTWDMVDEGGLAWDDWDAAGMTWAEFDLNGHRILETE